MSNKKIRGVSQFKIAAYLQRYSPSLRRYPEKYINNLFEKGSEIPDHFIYLCPFCLKRGVSFIEPLRQLFMNTELSLDHFPPASVGGQFTLLTCRPCNNDFGGSVDHALKSKMEVISFDRKIFNSQLKFSTSISGVKGIYKGALVIDKTGDHSINFFNKGKKRAPFLNQFLETENKADARLLLKFPDEEKVKKALVRAAYMFCFAIWGYDFAFSKPAQMIREYIAGDITYPVQTPLAWMGEEIINRKIESFPIGVCILIKPTQLRAYIVNLLLINKSTGFKDVVSVLIPNPTANGWEEFCKIQEEINKLPKKKTNVLLSPVSEFTIETGCLDGYTRTWASTDWE